MKGKTMKIWLIIGIVVALAIVGSVAWAYLAPPSPNVGDRGKLQVVRTAEGQRRIDTVTVSSAELAGATCDTGRNCWIAVDGVVYDMAVFPTWARGLHHGVKAGTDATEKFVGSNHGVAVLQKMPVVGRYSG